MDKDLATIVAKVKQFHPGIEKRSEALAAIEAVVNLNSLEGRKAVVNMTIGFLLREDGWHLAKGELGLFRALAAWRDTNA